MKSVNMIIMKNGNKNIANQKGEGINVPSAILDAQNKFLERGFVKYFFDKNYKIKIDFITNFKKRGVK